MPLIPRDRIKDKDDEAVASKMFAHFRALRSSLLAHDKPIDDPNVFTAGMAQMDPSFAARYPIVVKTIAVREKYFSRAFYTYLSFLRTTSLEQRMKPHLAQLQRDRDVTAVTDLSDRDRMEAKIRAQSEMDAEYVYLTLQEELRDKKPHTWRQHIRPEQRAALASEIYQQLQLSEERNQAALDAVRAEEKDVRMDRERHLSSWVRKAASRPDYEAEFEGLTRPSEHRTGASGDTDEFVPFAARKRQ